MFANDLTKGENVDGEEERSEYRALRYAFVDCSWGGTGVSGGGRCQELLENGSHLFLEEVQEISEGGVVVCFGLGESFFIRPNVVFVGFMVDSEARYFIEPLQVSTSGLKGTELNGEPGGRMGKGGSPGFNRGKGVKTWGDSSIIVDNLKNKENTVLLWIEKRRYSRQRPLASGCHGD